MKNKASILVATLMMVACLCDGISAKQMNYMAKLARMTCQSKTNASNGEINSISKGVFTGASKNVQCYIACIMKMSGTLNGSDLNYENAVKLADSMLPNDVKEPMKETLLACKNSGDPYKDPCEAAYHINECFYNSNPKLYHIP